MARMITYDEIALEILGRDDMNDKEREEALMFIRDFRLKISAQIVDSLPERLKGKLKIVVT